jgi:uncharacterized membrane protein
MGSSRSRLRCWCFDGRLIVLNLFYLAWIVLIPFSTQIFGDYGGAEAAVVLYALNMVAVILSGVLLFAWPGLFFIPIAGRVVNRTHP